MQWCVRIQCQNANNNGMHQIGAIGDTWEWIYAWCGQKSVNVATVAARAGDNNPGQTHGPHGVAEWTVGSTVQWAQLYFVQAIDQPQKAQRWGEPSKEYRELQQTKNKEKKQSFNQGFNVILGQRLWLTLLMRILQLVLNKNQPTDIPTRYGPRRVQGLS